MKTKLFDCVDMMHEGALRIYDETRGMTIEQELAFWRKRRGELQVAEEPPVEPPDEQRWRPPGIFQSRM